MTKGAWKFYALLVPVLAVLETLGWIVVVETPPGITRDLFGVVIPIGFGFGGLWFTFQYAVYKGWI